MITGDQAKNRIHIHKIHGVSYLYPYIPKKKLSDASEKRKDLIRASWKFMDGDPKSYHRFCSLYHDFLVQFLWIGFVCSPTIELAAMPRSDESIYNPLKEVCRDLSKRRYVKEILDGSDLLCRREAILPARNGNIHTIEALQASMCLTRKPEADCVIVLDDMTHTGRSARAVKELLHEAGVKEVYVLCLFATLPKNADRKEKMTDVKCNYKFIKHFIKNKCERDEQLNGK